MLVWILCGILTATDTLKEDDQARVGDISKSMGDATWFYFPYPGWHRAIKFMSTSLKKLLLYSQSQTFKKHEYNYPNQSEIENENKIEYDVINERQCSFHRKHNFNNTFGIINFKLMKPPSQDNSEHLK